MQNLNGNVDSVLDAQLSAIEDEMNSMEAEGFGLIFQETEALAYA